MALRSHERTIEVQKGHEKVRDMDQAAALVVEKRKVRLRFIEPAR